MEILIYHIAIAATFPSAPSIPSNAFETTLRTWKSSKHVDNEAYQPYCQSLLAGLEPSSLGRVYRAGRVFHGKVNVQSTQSLQQELSTLLGTYQREICRDQSTPKERVLSSVRLLYVLAALILVSHQSEASSSDGEDFSVHMDNLFEQGHQTLKSLSHSSAIIAFPMTIIGVLALSRQEKHAFEDLAVNSRNFGPKTVQWMLDLWQKCWSLRDHVEEHHMLNLQPSKRDRSLDGLLHPEVSRTAIL